MILRNSLLLLVFLAATLFPLASIPPASANSGSQITFIVTLRDQANLSRSASVASGRARQTGVVQALRLKAAVTQAGLLSWLEIQRAAGLVTSITPLWIFNGIVVTANASMMQLLAQRPEVLSITLNRTFQGPPRLQAGPPLPEPNLTVINAPALWALGIDGTGVVVANVDTGVDVTHPDLSSRWRGGTNSWYDPFGQHLTTPTDVNGHGTQTMGVMVGGSAGGTAIGVAPGARWIAARIFNDQNQGSTVDTHLAYQWLLDPDGNPATADAPQVVNSSWDFGSAGCDTSFQPDLQALRAAGILPIFAAGNSGPASGVTLSPANNPEAFAVGSVDNTGVIDTNSGRGPSTCGQPAGQSALFPALVAPGVSINTTDLFGLYVTQSGTSLAAPHVAGALALLLSKYPGLPLLTQEDALLQSAVDLGASGPDNTFGNGRLDALAAYQWLVAHYAAQTPRAYLPVLLQPLLRVFLPVAFNQA